KAPLKRGFSMPLVTTDPALGARLFGPSFACRGAFSTRGFASRFFCFRFGFGCGFAFGRGGHVLLQPVEVTSQRLVHLLYFATRALQEFGRLFANVSPREAPTYRGHLLLAVLESLFDALDRTPVTCDARAHRLAGARASGRFRRRFARGFRGRFPRGRGFPGSRFASGRFPGGRFPSRRFSGSRFSSNAFPRGRHGTLLWCLDRGRL